MSGKVTAAAVLHGRKDRGIPSSVRADRSTRPADAERRAFLRSVPTELNIAGWARPDLSPGHLALLRSWIDPADVSIAERALRKLLDRLPLKASELQLLMPDGVDRGSILISAHRLGLRIERVTPNGVDGIVYGEPTQKAAHPEIKATHVAKNIHQRAHQRAKSNWTRPCIQQTFLTRISPHPKTKPRRGRTR
jgi:hypothetical protein